MKIVHKQGANPLKKLHKKALHVGWFASAVHENGFPVAAAVAQNEFGNSNKNIPPRPALRNAIVENRGKWVKVAAKFSKDIVSKGITPLSALSGFGVVVESDLKKGIIALTSPALKESTVKTRKYKVAKGRKISSTIEKPLIESGLTLATLTSEVS